MKDYRDVIHERYSGREAGQHIYAGQYSLINPVGFYGTARCREVFYHAFNELRRRGVDWSQQTILDVGCGSGGWTRFFAELIGEPANIAGVDLSEHRIAVARRNNPAIDYQVADITKLPFDARRWNVVTAIDVFMHLHTREEIAAAFSGIHASLRPNGYFFLYDAFADTHFAGSNHDDSRGYNPREVESFAQAAGFDLLFDLPVFRRVGRFHSLYFARKGIPFLALELLERLLPGKPGNYLWVFQRSSGNR